MNKTLLTIAILGLLTLFSSAYYTAPADGRIGHRAPMLMLGNRDNNNNDLSPLKQHQGENILLSFWSSADAGSRLENMHYDRLSRLEGMHFVHVSVNMDRSVNVFNSIVALDGLDRSAHYCASSDAQESIIKSWRLDEGYHTFLIDTNGEIAAIDPDEQMLRSVR